MFTPESFDLSNGAVLLRLICAFFLIPHMYFKLVGDPPPSINTFIKAGYPKPLFFVRLALAVEVTCALALFFNFHTQYAALLLAAYLLVAATTLYFVKEKQFLWLWVKGGSEYAVFWALSCIALSMLYWH